MNRLTAFGLCSFLYLTVHAVVAQSPVIERYGDSFRRSAVLVDNAALAHTTQLLASDHSSTSRDQEIRDVFDRLSAALRDGEASKKQLVKLNLYVDDNETAKAAMAILEEWCAADARPAVWRCVYPTKYFPSLNSTFGGSRRVIVRSKSFSLNPVSSVNLNNEKSSSSSGRGVANSL